MSYKLDRVPGISTEQVRSLADVGIVSTGSLLIRCGNAEQRAHVAQKTGIAVSDLEHWASLVDLGRVSGVGLLTAERLLSCGISSVASLGEQSAEALAAALNAGQQAVNREALSVGRLARWIQQAHALRQMLR